MVDFGDITDGIARTARAAGEKFADGAGEVLDGAGRVLNKAKSVLDIDQPDDNDGGSSNWAAWGHKEIRAMLDNTVNEPGIHETVAAWRAQCEKDVEIITNLARDLNRIISEGWGGESGAEAIGALRPVNDWSVTFSEAAQRTADLMEHSGSSAGEAKATVPPAMQQDWKQTIGAGFRGGFGGAVVDAVAQDNAEQEARRVAVRIMENVYSAPINDNRVAVPHYPQPVDPTLQPPEPSPVVGPTPGAGLSRGGSGIPGGGGGLPGGSAPYQPPAAAGLQGAGSVDGGQFGPSAGSSPTGGGQVYGGTGYPGHGGGGQGLGAAAAAVPFMPPMAGGGDEQERARRGFRGAGPPGGRPGGVGGYPGGGGGGGYPGGGRGGGDFGPRGSSPSPAAAAAAGEGRAGMGTGGAAGGRGGGGVPGGVPVGGAGGRGQGAEDTEHRRPSYLIEMDDIFNDGRKVAPPVIGVDPPE